MFSMWETCNMVKDVLRVLVMKLCEVELGLAEMEITKDISIESND
jgi:hypothetical protein